MFKKFATVALLTGGMLIMGGTAFADNPVPGTGTDDMLSAQRHASCLLQHHSRACNYGNTNY